MWLCSEFRRPELRLPSAGGQGVRCGLNPCMPPFYLLGGAGSYYHKWNLWFLYRLENICLFYSFLQNLFSSPLAATVVWARRYSDLGFQISWPNYSLCRKKPQRFLNSQCLENMANWASPLWSQNAKSSHEVKTTWSKIIILVPCTWNYRPEFDEVILSTPEAVPRPLP